MLIFLRKNMSRKDDSKEVFSIAPVSSSSFLNKKEYPKISIITPSYNQGQFIEETIRSVIFQDYPNIEYIIIDGGSKDESVDIIRKYENQLSFWVSEPDDGQTDAINKGLKISTGDILAYINSDDVYCPDTFKIIADYFDQNPDIAMIYGNILHIDRDGKILCCIRPGKLDITQYLLARFYIPQPTVFFRSCVLDEIGYFDQRYHLAMDKDFWIRIMFNYQIGYIPKILAQARIYDEAKSTSQKSEYLDEHLMILDTLFSNADLLHYQNTITLNFKKFKREAYSSVYFQGGLAFLEIHQFVPAVHNIMKGIRLNPLHIIDKFLYWSLFVAFFGNRISDKILNKYRNYRDPLSKEKNKEIKSKADF